MREDTHEREIEREREVTGGGGAIETRECGKEEEGNWKKETDNLNRWIPRVDSSSKSHMTRKMTFSCLSLQREAGGDRGVNLVK